VSQNNLRSTTPHYKINRKKHHHPDLVQLMGKIRMASNLLTCPHCHTTLKLAHAVPSGKKVRCPRCQKAFTTGTEDEPEPRPSRPSGKSPRVAPRREDDEDEAPVRSHVTSKPPRRRPVEEDDEDDVEEPPRRRRGRSYLEDEDEEEYPRPRKKSKQKAGGSSARLWSLILGGATLLLVGGVVAVLLILNRGRDEKVQTPTSKGAFGPRPLGGQGEPGVGGGQGEVWTIPADQRDKLADYVSFGKGYRIRPPKGYTELTKPGPGGTTAHAWMCQPRPDGVRSHLRVITGTAPPEEANRYTPEKALQSMLNALKQYQENLSPTATEHGEINGVPFVRARWSGTNIETGKKMHGFVYACLQGQEFIQITSEDVEPGHEAPLKLAEASALSFRKSP
jgi:predicted Zn finger-like uncharacterized protein